LNDFFLSILLGKGDCTLTLDDIAFLLQARQRVSVDAVDARGSASDDLGLRARGPSGGLMVGAGILLLAVADAGRVHFGGISRWNKIDG